MNTYIIHIFYTGHSASFNKDGQIKFIYYMYVILGLYVIQLSVSHNVMS